MKISTLKCSVADSDYESYYELTVNMWKEKTAVEYIKTSLINNILKHSCYRYKWYA